MRLKYIRNVKNLIDLVLLSRRISDSVPNDWFEKKQSAAIFLSFITEFIYSYYWSKPFAVLEEMCQILTSYSLICTNK